VCPWNRFARTTREVRFLAKPGSDDGRDELHALLEISAAEFKRRFARSPILRVKRRGLLRNVCVVLGNIGTVDDLPPCAALASTRSRSSASTPPGPSGR